LMAMVDGPGGICDDTHCAAAGVYMSLY
jgi:hypothetical protein